MLVFSWVTWVWWWCGSYTYTLHRAGEENGHCDGNHRQCGGWPAMAAVVVLTATALHAVSAAVLYVEVAAQVVHGALPEVEKVVPAMHGTDQFAQRGWPISLLKGNMQHGPCLLSGITTFI